MVAPPQWSYDATQKKHVFTGSKAVLAEVAAELRLSLADLLDRLGLQAPPDLRAAEVVFAAPVEPAGTVAAAAATAAGAPAGGGGGGGAEKPKEDNKMAAGISQLKVLGKREGIDHTSAHSYTPLPPLDTALQTWRDWFGSRAEITEFQSRVALYDAGQFLTHNRDLALAGLDVRRYEEQAHLDSAILSGFFFTYDFSAPSFWCVFCHDVWELHEHSDELELAFSAHRGTGVAHIECQVVDFDQGTVRVGTEVFQLRRVTSALRVNYSYDPASTAAAAAVEETPQAPPPPASDTTTPLQVRAARRGTPRGAGSPRGVAAIQRALSGISLLPPSDGGRRGGEEDDDDDDEDDDDDDEGVRRRDRAEAEDEWGRAATTTPASPPLAMVAATPATPTGEAAAAAAAAATLQYGQTTWWVAGSSDTHFEVEVVKRRRAGPADAAASADAAGVVRKASPTRSAQEAWRVTQGEQREAAAAAAAGEGGGGGGGPAPSYSHLSSGDMLDESYDLRGEWLDAPPFVQAALEVLHAGPERPWDVPDKVGAWLEAPVSPAASRTKARERARSSKRFASFAAESPRRPRHSVSFAGSWGAGGGDGGELGSASALSLTKPSASLMNMQKKTICSARQAEAAEGIEDSFRDAQIREHASAKELKPVGWAQGSWRRRASSVVAAADDQAVAAVNSMRRASLAGGGRGGGGGPFGKGSRPPLLDSLMEVASVAESSDGESSDGSGSSIDDQSSGMPSPVVLSAVKSIRFLNGPDGAAAGVPAPYSYSKKRAAEHEAYCHSADMHPMIALLHMRFRTTVAIAEVIDALECIESPEGRIYASFSLKLVIVESKRVREWTTEDGRLYHAAHRTWQLFRLQGRLAKVTRSVATLLVDHADTPESAKVYSMLTSAIRGLPFIETTALKQQACEDVTMTSMNSFRKGNILINERPVYVRPTPACSINETFASFEFVASCQSLASVSRQRRAGDALLPPCILQVVIDLAKGSVSETMLCAVVSEISGDEIKQARLRQLLADCSDMRLVNAIGSAINAEPHIKLCYTDPHSSDRRVRIDKQRDEKPGFRTLIPTVTPYDVALLQPTDANADPRYRHIVGNMEMESLLKPHLPNVVVALLDHDSCIERVGITQGVTLSRVNDMKISTVEHAMRVIRSTTELTHLTVNVANPCQDYALWEICTHSDNNTFKVSPESSVLERAHKTFLKNRYKPGAGTFMYDAAMRGACVIVAGIDDCHFTEAHLPRNALDYLELFTTKDTMQWLTGTVPPDSAATVIGSMKSVPFRRMLPSQYLPSSYLNKNRSPTDPYEVCVPGRPYPEGSDCLKLFGMEEASLREATVYPPPAFTQHLQAFVASKKELHKPEKKKRAAAVLISSFVSCVREGRLGCSARLRSLNNFVQWYTISGYRNRDKVLYYLVSLDECNKVVLVQHSAIRVKDTIEFDLKNMTRRTLLGGDPTKWMLDVMRRVAKKAPSAVGDQGIEVIARAIELCPPGLQYLSLGGNDLSDDSVRHLTTALIFNPDIVSVNLDDNHRIQHSLKRSISCLIRCNRFDCVVNHDDLDFIDLLHFVLKQREDLLPKPDVRIVLSKNALGMLLRKGAQFNKAEEFFVVALSDAEELQAATGSVEAAHAVAAVQYNLGTLYLAKGDSRRGREIFIKSFASIMNVAGTKHPKVWQSLSKIADFYVKQREFEKALFWYDFITRELIASQGARCPLVAAAKQKSALVRVKVSDIKQAVYDLLYSLNILRSQMDVSELQLFKCMHAISEAMNLFSRPRIEWALDQQALHALNARYDTRRIPLQSLAEGILHLAEYYSERAETQPPTEVPTELFQRAHGLFLQALQHCVKLIPKRHPDFIKLSLQRTSTLLRCGRQEEALPLLQQLCKTTVEVLGEVHPLTADCTRWLAQYYHMTGDYDRALEILTRAMQQVDAHSSAEKLSPTLANILYDYGKTCAMKKKFETAEVALLRCLHIRQQIFGIEHSLVALAMLAIATLYEQKGMYDEAEDYSKRYLTVSLERYPETRPHILFSLGFLSSVRLRQGKHHESTELLRMRASLEEAPLRSTDRDALDAARLRVKLKNLGSLYVMKEVSWDARMQFVTTKATRTFPLDLIRALPPYDPFKREPGVPLSTIDQAEKLSCMTGLVRLVRHARVVDPGGGRGWLGLLSLERAVLSLPESDASRQLLAHTGSSSSRDINPAMFGAAEAWDEWKSRNATPNKEHAALLQRILAANWEVEGEAATASNSDPVASSALFVMEQLKAHRHRQQQLFCEEITLCSSTGMLEKYWGRLNRWVVLSRARYAENTAVLCHRNINESQWFS